MRKWENPELMTLGIENTKEENLQSKDLLHWCNTCKKPYPHWDWREHQHSGDTTPPVDPPLS